MDELGSFCVASATCGNDGLGTHRHSHVIYIYIYHVYMFEIDCSSSTTAFLLDKKGRRRLDPSWHLA